MKGKHKPTKRIHIRMLIIIYILLAAIPFWRHKKVTDPDILQFNPADCYSQTPNSERVAYIADNRDAMLYRLQMIQAAQHEIKYSTFEILPDDSGKDVLSALLTAAERGVKVSFITDGFNALLHLNRNPYFQAFAAHENITVKIYNRRSLLKPTKLQACLHDKYMLIDNTMYLLGGRNTENRFLGNYNNKQNIDCELFVYNTSPELPASQQQLDEYFQKVFILPDNSLYQYKKNTTKTNTAYQELINRQEHLKQTYPEAFESPDWIAQTIPVNKITLLANPITPNNKEPWLWHCLKQLMLTGQDITIHTPYIICGKEMYQDLTAICDQAETVKVIINDPLSGANPWGCTDYLNQKKNIEATGLQLYQYSGPYSIHTKTIRIDDRLSIIGSFNLDMRSTYIDTELMLVIDSPELNRILQEQEPIDLSYCKTSQTKEADQKGPNYIEKELTPQKSVFYAILRVLTVPIRRFL